MAVAPPPDRIALSAPNTLRRRLQWPGVLGFLGVGVGLILAPAVTLRLLWQVVIPLLPATFFLSPSLWRAACPLATAGLLAVPPGAGRALDRPATETAGMVGLLLLLVLVPLRHLVLEHDPQVLLLLLVGLVVLAAVLGRGHDMKAGFCNAICPVLPVERLYGQAPLLSLGDQRCGPCTRCTPVGCPDRAPTTAFLSMIGSAAWWPVSPYGAFLAGFPGFVVGFGLVPRDADVTVLQAYGPSLLGFGLSWLIVATAVRLFQWTARAALPWLAWATASGYYWFASESLRRGVGLGPAMVWPLRGVALLGLALWLHRAVQLRQAKSAFV